MATTKCDRKVKFKKAGSVSLYATASDKSKKTTKTVDTKTTYKATQLVPNKWYYISEFKKWVKMSLVENVNSTKKANTTTSTTKVKFNEKNTAKVSVYKKSSLSGATIDVKSWSTVKGKTYSQTKTEGKASYIKEFSGWVATSRLTTVAVSSIEQTTVKVIQEWKTRQEADAALQKLLSSVVSDNETGSSMVSASGTGDLPVTDPHGLYGIPYQFPDFVDRTIPGTVFGHYYTDRIISRMPTLILSPGKVTFMKNSSTETRDKMIDIISSVLNGADTDLQSFITSPGKYYSFDYDATTYWEYVNTMNRASAIFLGIGDVIVTIDGYTSKLADFRWENAMNKKFGTWLQSTESFVSFYADSESSTGEDFSNTTMESSIASSLNKSSDLGKEIRFLLGEHGVLSDLVSEDTIDIALKSIDGISNAILAENNIVSQLGKEFAVIATGGKLIFPEIWSDSTFTRDFDVKLKLRCPCPNKVAWFFDICSPINHLLAFTLPRTPYGQDIAGRIFASDVTPNGYFSPFLVRGMYKGISNVDMGIVTALRIDKGKEGSWTIDGLPTEVDVSMTIKDLYNVMAMTPYERKSDLLNNTQFLGYLAFNCGISINQPDIVRTSLLWASIDMNATYNSIKDTITGYNFWKKKKQQIQNFLTDMTAGFFS